MNTSDLHIRDPFVLVDGEKGLYPLYAQSGNRAGSGYTRVEAYTSRDLQEWTPPRPVLELPAGAGVRAVWAPEVHAMLFRSLEGKRWMALHQPNERGRERMRLYRVVDLGETLAIEQEA